MRYRWDNYTGFPRDLYIASHARDFNLEMRKKYHLFEAFFRSIVLSHAKMHNSDGLVNGEELTDWGLRKYIEAFEGKY